MNRYRRFFSRYFLPCAAALWTASANAELYELMRCGQTGDGVALAFLGPKGQVRRVAIGSKVGVEVSGNVQRLAPLKEVKELAVAPLLEVTYVSGDQIKFGAIDPACERLMRRMVGPLVRIRGR